MSAPLPRALPAVLIGASGRMGQAVLAAAAGFPALRFTAAIVSKDSALMGIPTPVGALRYGCDLDAALAEADVVIDFSAAAATQHNLAACVSARRPLVIGTTGYPGTLEAEIDRAARAIPLLVAANTSVGVTLLSELVTIAAAALPGEFAVGIQESHHRDKRDAPSGTALALSAAAAAARASRGASAGEIHIESIRAGDIVGEHAVRFFARGEELTLSHKASDRSVFARGALAAALWLSSRRPGRYSMRDVLAIKTAT